MRAAADALGAVVDDPDAREGVGDRGDVGRQPVADVTIGRDVVGGGILPVRAFEQRRDSAAGALGEGMSNQDCSDSHVPAASVDRVVPPTLVISGSEATESRPMLSVLGAESQSSPPLLVARQILLASKAVVPVRCASRNAERTGARSAAVISLSQPQPIEKLRTARGTGLRCPQAVGRS